jgi:hypothetical protein
VEAVAVMEAVVPMEPVVPEMAMPEMAVPVPPAVVGQDLPLVRRLGEHRMARFGYDGSLGE